LLPHFADLQFREGDWVSRNWKANSEIVKPIENEWWNQRYLSSLWIETWVHGKLEFQRWKDIWLQRNIFVIRWDRGEIGSLDKERFWKSEVVSPRINNSS
jgi:hypothetical protein